MFERCLCDQHKQSQHEVPQKTRTRKWQNPSAKRTPQRAFPSRWSSFGINSVEAFDQKPSVEAFDQKPSEYDIP